jgi:hypothetical protein
MLRLVDTTPAHSFAQRAESLGGRVALVAGGAAFLVSRVPTAAQTCPIRVLNVCMMRQSVPANPQHAVVLRG